MVSRATTTALLLLTLVVMAAPALADDSSSPVQPVLDRADGQGPCPVWSVTTKAPFVEVHPECA